jgi:hypothetical protein
MGVGEKGGGAPQRKHWTYGLLYRGKYTAHSRRRFTSSVFMLGRAAVAQSV